MSYDLKYKGTVRAVSDRLAADIYLIKGSKQYLIVFFGISYAGKKQLLRKMRFISPKAIDYSALKKRIRDTILIEAYNEIPLP